MQMTFWTRLRQASLAAVILTLLTLYALAKFGPTLLDPWTRDSLQALLQMPLREGIMLVINSVTVEWGLILLGAIAVCRLLPRLSLALARLGDEAGHLIISAVHRYQKTRREGREAAPKGE